jgi:PAS domain S-box-containing protein
MKRTVLFAVALLVLAALYASSLYNFLLFHSLAEVFAIVIACGIFLVTWNCRRYLDNQYLLFIGIACLFIAILDLAHTLAYKGMPVLPGYGANAPTQLWIAARYMESLSLLAAPAMFRRRIRPGYCILAFGAVTMLLLLSIFYWRIFPDCYLESTGGLTPFKKISEYIICLVLLASGASILYCRDRFDSLVLRWLLMFIGLTVLSELAFTTYVSVYGPANLLGHYLKIVSFYCIYKAVIESGLAKPFELLFRDLKQSQERYRALFVHMINGFATHRVEFDRQGRPVDYRFLETNAAFEELTGLSGVIGKRVTEVIPGIENDPADWIGVYGTVATTGNSTRFDNYSEKLNKWYSVLAYSPGPGEFATVFEDVSQRKLAEEELRRQREWLRVILSSIGDAVIATDVAGRIAFLNPVAAALTCWPAETALNLPVDSVFRIIDETTGEPDEDIVRKVLADGRVITLANHTALVTRDGRKVPIEDCAAPIRETGGGIVGVVIVFHDVTAKRAAQAALRTSEARFKLLSSTAGRLLATQDPQSLVEELCRAVMGHLDCQVFFNYLVGQRAGRLHLNACAGVSAEQAREIEWLDYGSAVCGCAARDRKRIIAEDILNSADPRTALVKSFGIQAYCCHPLNIQDRLIGTLSFGTRTRTHFAPDEVELMRTIADQVALAMQRIQTQQALQEANKDLEHKVRERTATLAQTVDTLEAQITLRERAEDELRLANRQLAARADQLRALTGELTMAEQRERMRLSKILHDGLQQHLAIAKLQLGAMIDRMADADLQKTGRDIETLLGESIQISRSLSADLSPPVLYEGGLCAGLEWLAGWMRDKHGFRVALGLETVGPMPEDVKVLVFESVRELLFNAVKHAGVSCAQVCLKQGNAEGIRVTVSDQGAGFDIGGLPPVDTNGAGFGLFSVRERIGLIGGCFEMESAPGEGSRFTLTIPHGRSSVGSPGAGRPIETIGPQAAANGSSRHTAMIRVLIADDHSLFRDGVARLVNREPDLEVVGQACDGREVIELACKLLPDVILMDVNMPGISGLEATRIIHRQAPRIQIIGLSMHADQDHAQAMRRAGAADYQNKGCAASELVAAIRICAGSACGPPDAD